MLTPRKSRGCETENGIDWFGLPDVQGTSEAVFASSAADPLRTSPLTWVNEPST